MSRPLTRKSMRNQTVIISIATIASRAMGALRDMLMANYLGVSPLSDAFIAAFKLPNSLRKIFAEGALNSALIPTLNSVYKHDGLETTNKTLTLVFGIFLGLVALICCCISYAAPLVIYFMVPGWFGENNNTQVIEQATQFLRILIWFLFCISGTAIIAGALQIKNKFILPALLPFILNIGYITSLIVCFYYQLPPMYLAAGYLFFSFITLIVHVFVYRFEGFSFIMPDKKSLAYALEVLKKFIPCIFTLGAVEINLLIDQAISSYLPEGSVTLISYSSAFVRLPLALFTQGFSILFFTHVSRIAAYARNRLSFLLHESIKLIWWVSLPCTILMMAFSFEAFKTAFLSKQFTLESIVVASNLLAIFVTALFSFSINKLLVSLFYAVHDTLRPTYCTVITTALNTVLNVIFIQFIGIYGIALATAISEIIKTILLITLLIYYHNFKMYSKRLVRDLVYISIHALLVLGGFFASYYLFQYLIQHQSLLSSISLTYPYSIWVWLLPLAGVWALVYWYTYTKAYYRLFFLD